MATLASSTQRPKLSLAGISRILLLPVLSLLGLAGQTQVAVATVTLEFEDLFGPCGDSNLVSGPGSPMIEGVQFTSPDAVSFNAGKEYSFPPGLGNPFDSDAYLFFTFGSGATIDFPVPIDALRFRAGVTTNQQTFPTFTLSADGEDLATFGANLFFPTQVDVTLPQPVTRVTIRFVEGSSSNLGVDTLEYDPAGTSAVDSELADAAAPQRMLSAPVPNPVTTAIACTIQMPRAGPATVRLFHPSGRLIDVLFARELTSGTHRLHMTLDRLPGGTLPSGVYYLRLEAIGRVETQRIVVAR